jgi:hypothetical protein
VTIHFGPLLSGSIPTIIVTALVVRWIWRNSSFREATQNLPSQKPVPPPIAPLKFSGDVKADAWRAGYVDAIEGRPQVPGPFLAEPYDRGYGDGTTRAAKTTV